MWKEEQLIGSPFDHEVDLENIKGLLLLTNSLLYLETLVFLLFLISNVEVLDKPVETRLQTTHMFQILSMNEEDYRRIQTVSTVSIPHASSQPTFELVGADSFLFPILPMKPFKRIGFQEIPVFSFVLSYFDIGVFGRLMITTD